MEPLRPSSHVMLIINEMLEIIIALGGGGEEESKMEVQMFSVTVPVSMTLPALCLPTFIPT